MKLSHLLKKAEQKRLEEERDPEITGISYDSRKTQRGDLFVAIKGSALDGHRYISQAIEAGALAVVVEESEKSSLSVPVVKVNDSRKALSMLASGFYDYPCRDLSIVGITGTNGKTTISYMLESILSAWGKRTGVTGTNNCRFSEKTYPSTVTTPESLDLMRLMREMADNGVTHLVMEVSSHALDQNRTWNIPFKVGVYTNITRDHLDYHKDMDRYFLAKSLLFRGLGEESFAVINIDDPKGEEMASLTRARVLTYGVEGDADFKADTFKVDGRGISARILTSDGIIKVNSPLLGKVNIYNMLASFAAARALGVEYETIIKGFGDLKTVPGRLEPVSNEKGLSIVVDYAHTPDALDKAQENLRPLTFGRLITVFGCGGDRDRGKRFDMGLSAGKNSDLVIITSDNPRSEDPGEIISQIEKGIRESGLEKIDSGMNLQSLKKGYLVEKDRRRAIEAAVAAAGPGDVILIAGKGHEDYQIVGGERKQFDDRKEALRAVNRL